MLHAETLAMAFRILRMNGYDVSSGILLGRPKSNSILSRLYGLQFINYFEYHIDVLALAVEGTCLEAPNQGHFNDIRSVLELYKASKVRLSENELSLENIGKRSGSLLTEMLSNAVIQRTILFDEVIT